MVVRENPSRSAVSEILRPACLAQTTMSRSKSLKSPFFPIRMYITPLEFCSLVQMTVAELEQVHIFTLSSWSSLKFVYLFMYVCVYLLAHLSTSNMLTLIIHTLGFIFSQENFKKSWVCTFSNKFLFIWLFSLITLKFA